MNNPMLGWGQPTDYVNKMNQNASSLLPNVSVDQLSAWSTPNGGANPPSIAQPSFMQGMLGSTDADGMKTNGWGNLALGAGQGIFNGWMGLQQLDMAKENLSENKRQFNLNWGAQKNLTNSRLESRQKQRLANRPGEYRSVSDYMSEYGVK